MIQLKVGTETIKIKRENWKINDKGTLKTVARDKKGRFIRVSKWGKKRGLLVGDMAKQIKGQPVKRPKSPEVYKYELFFKITARRRKTRKTPDAIATGRVTTWKHKEITAWDMERLKQRFLHEVFEDKMRIIRTVQVNEEFQAGEELRKIPLGEIGSGVPEFPVASYEVSFWNMNKDYTKEFYVL